MRLLYIDCSYYFYPENITSLEDYIVYIKKHYNSFIPMVTPKTENCIEPFFIEDDTQTVFLNVSQIKEITEIEAQVLTKSEYDECLKNVIKSVCINCIHCEGTEDDIDSHRDKIDLNGKCWSFEKKTD